MKMGCLSSPVVRLILTVLVILTLIGALIATYFIVDMVSDDALQAEQNSLKLELDALDAETTSLQSEIDSIQKSIDSNTQALEEANQHLKITKIHHDMVLRLQIFHDDNWDQAEFVRTCDPGTRGLIEYSFNVDFDDPTPWSEEIIQQLQDDARQQLDVFRHNNNISGFDPKDIDIARENVNALNLRTDLEALRLEVEKSHTQQLLDASRAARDAKQAEFNALHAQSEVHTTRAAAGTLVMMGVTTLTTLGMGALAWKTEPLDTDGKPTVNKASTDNGKVDRTKFWNGAVGMMMLSIIALILALGLIGLIDGSKNMFFLRITQYVMYITFSAMLAGMFFSRIYPSCVYGNGNVTDPIATGTQPEVAAHMTENTEADVGITEMMNGKLEAEVDTTAQNIHAHDIVSLELTQTHTDTNGKVLQTGDNDSCCSTRLVTDIVHVPVPVEAGDSQSLTTDTERQYVKYSTSRNVPKPEFLAQRLWDATNA